MGDRRLKIGPFLGIWAVLVGLQALALVGPLAELPVAVRVGWVLLFQVAKIWPTAWRLDDTGREPTDAPFLALVPIVNVAAFFSRMLEGTPSEKLRLKRRGQWEGRLGAFRSIGEGLALVRDTLPLGAPLVVLYAIIGAAGGHWMLERLAWAEAVGPDTLGLAIQVLWGVAAFLGLYTLLQFAKRRTASRSSWLPSLFLAPLIMLAGALTLLANGMGQELGPLVLSLLLMSWNLVWASIGGAALAVGQITLGDRASRGERATAVELFEQIRTRTIDVAGPHGARVHAVTIGMQVVIPGIFYALQLAFTDMVAVLKPEEPALTRSGRLTWGMRSRLFKVFLVWFLVAMGVSAGIGYALETPEVFAASFFDPRAIGMRTFFLQELAWAFASWVLEMTLLAMYFDRVAREAARQAAPATPPEAVAANAWSAPVE